MRLIVTPGEPAGIGPDVLIQAAQSARATEWVVAADGAMLRARAASLKCPLSLYTFDPDAHARSQAAGELALIDVATVKTVQPGCLDVANAPYVLRCLDVAIAACEQGQVQALVTGAIQKSVINDAGIAFTGHTEYLAARAGGPVVMMLATEGLRVALATTHLPLRAVPDALTQPLLEQVLCILDGDLRRQFGIAKPRILVCGLNPHAGEGGHMGREEIDVMEPVLARLRAQGMTLIGPLPADTLFQPKYLEQADAVLAMYHDQGLPVLKYKGFGGAVNITLGLPYIRTSVDHGTALDLAGTGKANPGSLLTAIEYATRMATSRTHP